MVKALFVQDGCAIDYTPAAAVAAGDVVSLGALIGIAKSPIDASKVGALAIEGVFDFLKSGSAGPVFAIGDAVHWDTVNGLATRTGGSGHLFLGTAIAAAATGDTTVRVRLAPHGLPAWLQGKLWEDVSLAGGSKTLDAEDVGKVLNVTAGHASNVITLPATGAQYRSFVVRVATDGQRVAVSPNASDKIMGPDIAGVDDTDMILAAATSKVGDYLALGYGGTDGWQIDGRRGVFT